jgi:ribosomal protein S18 acetylase RimI-like enzyme
MDAKVKMLQSIRYRPALESDVDFLYALHVATMKDYVDKTWGWDDAFQESIFRKNYDPVGIEIIMFDGKEMGMLSIEERDDDIFLRVIEIHPAYQNKRIATSIINRMIADGAQRKKPVRLRVLKVNPAKRLYERLGFSVIEETPTHYIMMTSTSN